MYLCNYCGEKKPLSDFNLNSNGLPRKMCKTCHRTAYYRYEKLSQSAKEAKKAATVAKAAVEKAMRKYFRCAVKCLTKYAETEAREKRRLESRAKERKSYRQRNPLEKLVRRHNWKARKQGVLGCLSVSGIRSLVQRQGYVCAICGVVLAQGDNLNVDHVIPKSKGGTNTDDNIQLLCAECNTAKGVSLPEQKTKNTSHKH